MKFKVCMLLICLFTVAGLALAQAKVDGKWTAEIQGGRGPQMVTLTFKTEGGKVSGKEHRFPPCLVSSPPELLYKGFHHRLDGLAIELHCPPLVDLDQDEVILQIVERA